MNKKILMMGFTAPEEGGSERHIYEIASNLDNVTVLTQKGTLCKNKIEVPVLKISSFLRNLSFFIVCFFYTFKLLIKKKHDVIHIHENLLYFLAPLLKLRYEIIITVHGIKGFKFHDSKFWWKLFSSMLKSADKIIAVNLEDKKVFEKIFKKVNYIPNGVDFKPYEAVKTNVEKKISFIGRVHEQKGIIYLMQAFKEFNKKNPEYKLEIIGEVNDYAKQLKKEFNNPNLIWKGYMGNRIEIAKCLKSAYCIALPSLWEGLPLTLFESLASGRPVVISNIPAFKSVIKNEAIFFKNKDFQDLDKKLNEIIKDNKKANKIGELGKTLAREYSWEEISKTLQKVYNE